MLEGLHNEHHISKLVYQIILDKLGIISFVMLIYIGHNNHHNFFI